MKKNCRIFTFVVLLISVSACGAPAQPTAVIAPTDTVVPTSTSLPPTAIQATPTATLAPNEVIATKLQDVVGMATR